MLTTEIYEGNVGFFVDLSLFMIGFLFTIVSSLVIFKKITPIIIALSIFVGICYETINIFINVNFMPDNVNYQLITALWMQVSALCLAVSLMFKKGRTLDRKVVLTTAIAVIAGWYVIHTSLVISKLIYEGDLILNSQVELISDYVAEDDRNGFIAFCNESGYDCVISNEAGKFTHKSNSLDEIEMSKGISSINSEPFEFEIDGVILNGFKGATYNQTQVSVVVLPSGKNTFVLFDAKHILDLFASIKFAVYAWFGIVASFWVTLMFVALFAHKSHFKKLKNKRVK